MARAIFVFNETSPSAPGTAASSQAVAGAASFMPAGVAGPMQDYEAVDVIAEIAGATGGPLSVYLQISPDDGLNWYDLIAWPVAAAGSGVKYYQSPVSNATNTPAPVPVGKNLGPALANAGLGTVVNGAFSDRMRLIMVAGALTTAGAAVVVRAAPQRGEGGRSY
jgi:hypothetical protein